METALFGVMLSLIYGAGDTAFAEDWADIRTVGPFVCRADFSLKSSEFFLGELAQLQNDLIQSLGIPPARGAIEIYLIHDRPTYERYLKQYFPQVPFRRAVYIQVGKQGRVFAFHGPQFEIDVRHECTHALLHAGLATVPLWLDEGLAGYFELPAAQRAYDNDHLSGIRWNVWWGFTPSLQHLEQCTSVEQMGKTEYRDSWAWVHFMLHGPAPAHEELMRFLQDLQQPNPQNPPGLLSERLKRRLPSVDADLAAHFKSWRKK